MKDIEIPKAGVPIRANKIVPRVRLSKQVTITPVKYKIDSKII